MKIDDSQSTENYFKTIAKLAERLATKKIAIYEHEFSYMAFGSWTIVAGRRSKMLTFTYDGKESCVSYCDALVKTRSHTDLQHHRFATHRGEDPLDYLAEVLEKEFSK